MITPINPQLMETIQTIAPRFAAIRRDIHAHPELCFEEQRTADIVAKALTDMGIPIHRGLGKTGVVGIVRGTQTTNTPHEPSIGLRADMDALPMQEHNTFAHTSQFANKMHACGHDGHTAMLLCAAQYLSEHRDFAGTVYLIFQPAEEGGGGANVMIQDGLFTQFPMDAVYALHNWPGLPPGEFAVASGPVMASSSEFVITVRGKGGHAALPHTTIDPIPVACQLVMALQTIVSRNKKPVDAGVISVTMLHGGQATNVVPDSVELQGTVRTFTYDVLDMIEKRMQEISQHLCAAHDCESTFAFHRNYPPTINSPVEAAFAQSVMQSVVGEAKVHVQEPTMGAEDFSFMLQVKPGCYAFIGNGVTGEHRGTGHDAEPCVLHNPTYDFNDAIITTGATYWVALVQAYFQSQS